MTRPPVISVRTDVVQRFLVEGLLDAALARMEDELAPEVGATLDRALEALAGAYDVEPSDEAGSAAGRLARAGYATRLIERERFEPAREPAAWLEELLRTRFARPGSDWPATVAAVSGELARREPAAKPRPDDPDAATWRVPGPGGHVRHLLALGAAGRLAPDGDTAELKRCWTYGLLVRACEEAWPPTCGRAPSPTSAT